MNRLLFFSGIVVMLVVFGCADISGKEFVMQPVARPCPDSPNCVSSQETRTRHLIDPLRYTGSRDRTRQRLLDTLASLPRVRIVTQQTAYIHAEFRSRVFRFVDDVEFWFPADDGVIHVRSASRSGYWDLGANRRRVERIRQAFEKNRMP